LREEVQTVSEATKLACVEKSHEQAQGESKADADIRTDAERRVGAGVKVEVFRDLLEGLVRDVFNEKLKSLLTSIQTCEDGDRLLEAIRQICKAKSLKEFHLYSVVIGLLAEQP
jgi:hypothetical protein